MLRDACKYLHQGMPPKGGDLSWKMCLEKSLSLVESLLRDIPNVKRHIRVAKSAGEILSRLRLRRHAGLSTIVCASTLQVQGLSQSLHEMQRRMQEQERQLPKGRSK